jgi:hypothetical protein
MLILPPGHNAEIARRGRLAGRERRLVAGVGVLAIAIAVAVVIGIAGGGASVYKKGCLNVTFASSVGSQTVVRCGTQARDTCESLGEAGGFTGSLAQTFAEQCRRLHLPVR